MKTREMGSCHLAGEDIIREGEKGNSMYVIQKGEVEVIRKQGDREVSLAVLGEGEFFGEMALFDRVVRSATVRARTNVMVLSIDRRALFRRIQEDPSLAMRLLERMSQRIREMNNRLMNIRGSG